MKDNRIKNNLEEKFKQLLPDEKAPAELKAEVFGTLDTFTLLGDIVDLFTTKFTATEAEFLNIHQDEKE
ncbi:MAG: hypothetical protein R2828_21355 [Saprospiraceae bacterium]